MTKDLFLYTSLIVFVVALESCLFSPDIGPDKSPWDIGVGPKEADKSCECGKVQETLRDFKPWQMFIVTKEDNKLLCIGTIIASNLLITSHDCLQRVNRSIGIYDVWSPSETPRNLYNPEEYWMAKDPSSTTSDFRIVNVFYSHQFGVNRAMQPSQHTKNVVLFHVTPDFTTDLDLCPVCLPKVTDPVENLIGKPAYTYGETVMDTMWRGTWDYLEKCGMNPPTTSPSPSSSSDEGPFVNTTPVTIEPNADELDIPFLDTIYGEVLDDHNCDDFEHEEDETVHQFLCFQQKEQKKAKLGNAALFFRSSPSIDESRFFLIGIAATAPINNESKQLIQFNKITALLSYIEHHAVRVGSKWCSSDNLVLTTQKLTSQEEEDQRNQLTLDVSWAEEGANPLRNETLECACGVQNMNHREGQNVAKFEFPWMVRVHGYRWYYVAGSRLDINCTGTVINDRVILTAARCVTKPSYNEENFRVHQAFWPDYVFVHIKVQRHHLKGGWYTASRLPRVAALYFHPYYDFSDPVSKFSVNIALVVLKRPLQFVGCGDGIRPICLPTSSHKANLGGIMANIAGWDLTGKFVNAVGTKAGSDGKYSTVLRKGVTKIADPEDCKQSYPQEDDMLRIRSLCSQHLDGYSEFYFSEDGSPLMIQQNGAYPRFTQIGLYFPDREQLSQGLVNLAYYVDVRDHLQFIDHYSRLHGAGWCQPIRVK